MLPGLLSVGVCFSLQIECAAYNPEPQPPDPTAPARGFLWVSRLSVPTALARPGPAVYQRVRGKGGAPSGRGSPLPFT